MVRKLLLAGTAASWIAFWVNLGSCLFFAGQVAYAPHDEVGLVFRFGAGAGVAWLTHRWGLVLLERECRPEDK